MRVLIATDAWHPQVNGVVRTLTSLAASAKGLGVTIEFLTPDGFPSIALPTYAGLRLALPNRREIAHRIAAAQPDAIHIATEGPIGLAARALVPAPAACRSPRATRRGFPNTSRRASPIPESLELRGAAPLPWRRGRHDGLDPLADGGAARARLPEPAHVDARRRHRSVRPERAMPLDLPRPIFLTAGRVAVEKNLEAFLSLDLPGTKVVVGDGPQEAELRAPFPGCEVPRPAPGRRARRTDRRRRRVRVSEPHRHFRRGPARGARLRRAGRGLSGHRAEGRDRRPRDRRARRRPASGLPRCAEHFARGVPRLRADALLDDERAAIHRSRRSGRDEQVAPAGRRPSGCGVGAGLDAHPRTNRPIACMERTQWR